MALGRMTLGKAISERRKELRMTQRELASKILKEDNKPISLPYLNDIEHDKRTPTNTHFLKQFATALGISENLLHFYVLQIPAEVGERFGNINYKDQEVVDAAFDAFTKVLEKAKAA